MFILNRGRSGNPDWLDFAARLRNVMAGWFSNSLAKVFPNSSCETGEPLRMRKAQKRNSDNYRNTFKPNDTSKLSSMTSVIMFFGSALSTATSPFAFNPIPPILSVLRLAHREIASASSAERSVTPRPEKMLVLPERVRINWSNNKLRIHDRWN